MRKLLFKPFLQKHFLAKHFLAKIFIAITLLFCTFSLKATEYFTVQAKIKPIVAQKSFNQLTNKYIKIKDLRTDNLYLTKLESLLNTTYERFYPSVWSYVRIYDKTEPNFMLTQAGIIIQRRKNNGPVRQYVRSFDGKIEVPLQTAIDAVERAIQNEAKKQIQKHEEKNTTSQTDKSHKNRPSLNKIRFNLRHGAELLYDPADPANTKAKNVLVVQNISLGKLGTSHRLYTLEKEIISELSKLGLKPKNTEFWPHINLANLVSKDCKIINKLKELSKNKKSGISKILNSVFRIKSLPSCYLNFDKIIITKGSLKNSKTLKTLDIK